MAGEHGWHLFDAEQGLEVRQTTPETGQNEWEIRFSSGATVTLTDEEFDQLRAGGWDTKEPH